MKTLQIMTMMAVLQGCASQEWKDYCQVYDCFDDSTAILNNRTTGGWIIIQKRFNGL